MSYTKTRHYAKVAKQIGGGVSTISTAKVEQLSTSTPLLLQDSRNPLLGNGYLRQPQVLELVPFSAATLWRLCALDKFPRPVKLSERVTAWKTSAVLSWLDSQGAV